MRLFLLLCSVALAFGCSGNPAQNASPTNTTSTPANSGPPPVYGYEIVKKYPHDPKAFTEGLYYKDGFLYESTGEENRSSLRKVEIETGKIVQKWDNPKEDFGEGIAQIGDHIYQLTYIQGICRMFNANDFSVVKEFSYSGQGWGMTTDGKLLYMTDGSHVIRVMDPETFRSTRMIVVMRPDGKPLLQINELEWIKGELWGNIWHSELPDILGKPNYLVRIDPQSGKILGWVDLAGISPDDQPKPDKMLDPNDPKSENTLNGIAYDAENDRIFVTGKEWKNLYEIKITPPKNQ